MTGTTGAAQESNVPMVNFPIVTHAMYSFNFRKVTSLVASFLPYSSRFRPNCFTVLGRRYLQDSSKKERRPQKTPTTITGEAEELVEEPPKVVEYHELVPEAQQLPSIHDPVRHLIAIDFLGPTELGRLSVVYRRTVCRNTAIHGDGLLASRHLQVLLTRSPLPEFGGMPDFLGADTIVLDLQRPLPSVLE